MDQKDYYQVLEVEKGADQQRIKEAYRRLAFQYHPDRNKGDMASVEKMKEINEAYAVLSDRQKRSRYDALRQEYGGSAYDHFRQNYSEQDIFRGSDINKIFEEMARGFGFRGFDEVFREFYGQSFRTTQFRGPGIFGRIIVFGDGSHDRDPGVRGTRVSGKQGLMAGVVNWIGRYAVRKLLGLVPSGGKDIHGTITLDEREASRGGRVIYLDEKRSRELTIAIPPGITEGQVIRLRGIGDGDGQGEKGDLYLKVAIKKPFLNKVRELLKV